MGKFLNSDLIILDFEKRKQAIIDDTENFQGKIGEYMKAGAVLALNDAISIIKKMAEPKKN